MLSLPRQRASEYGAAGTRVRPENADQPGHLSLEGAAGMMRELIEIEPSAGGWLVRSPVLPEAEALYRPTKLQAIEEAHTLAARRYVESGHPTAVLVPMGGGTSVIIATCG
jgi:hypothetical protein